MALGERIDSYDFFAKTLPGIAFLLGTGTLLPRKTINSIIQSQPSLASSFITFVSILVIIALLGVLLGEGIHTFSVIIEKMFDWFGRRYVKTRGWLYNNSEWFRERIDREMSSLSESQLEQMRIWNIWWHNIKIYLRNKFRNGKFVLIGHRRSLELILLEKIKDSEGNSIFSEMKFYEEYFVKKCLLEYEIEPLNFSNAYPVVASVIEENNCDRSSKFQSRYAFCRGMWVIALFFAIAYALVILYPVNYVPFKALFYVPFINTYTNSEIYLFIFLLIVVAMLFMNSAMRYKLLFIEYLLAEIYTVDRANSDEFEEAEDIEFEYDTTDEILRSNQSDLSKYT